MNATTSPEGRARNARVRRRFARSGDLTRPSRRASRGVVLAAVAAGAVTALLVHRQARQAERDNPPIGHFIEVDGVRLHYLERGRGQPVVLLHGNGSMVQDFVSSGLVNLLSNRYRVIVFDRPGYGYSERPRTRVWTPAAQAGLMHQALQQLGVERPIVVGHSWGTLVAVALALLHPADVRRLVLMSGYYFPAARLDVLLVSPPAIPVVGDVMRYTISPLLGRLMWRPIMRRIFGPATEPQHFRDGFSRGMALRPSQLRAGAAEAALMIPSAIALQHRYGELQMPVVVMAGADDQHVNAERQSARLHRELAGSELRLPPGVGHMVHQNVPEQVVEAIDAAAEAA